MNIPFVASTVLFNLLIAGIFVAEKQKMCDGLFDFPYAGIESRRLKNDHYTIYHQRRAAPGFEHVERSLPLSLV